VSIARSARAVAVLALALVPAALCAQRIASFGGGVGVVVPNGSFGDVEKAGWQLSALAIGPLTGSVQVMADVMYGQTTHQGGVAGSSKLAAGTLSAALFMGTDARRIRLFLSAGVGVFRVDVGVPGFGSAAATRLAPTAGIGVLVGSGRRRAFLMARYVSVGTKPQSTSFLPISAGVILTRGSR
jgi:hypothetical protein